MSILEENKLYLHNCDNMEFMKTIPDKFFELSICDPEYGIKRAGQKKFISKKNVKHNRKFFEDKKWDNEIPSNDYFQELFRISKNQIIWGGNYFTEFLKPTKAWIFWYKGQRDLTMSDGELAWTSFDTVTRQFELNRFALNIEGTIHPTQKPISLYKWLLSKYAKPNDKIFDSHLGSMSSVIAAYEMGFEIHGCELDKEYFDSGTKRVTNVIRQLKLF